MEESPVRCKSAKSNNYFKWLIKLDRLSAWTLFVVVILYAVSGYGMTKGLIDRTLATNLHLNLLGAVGLVAFTIHSWCAIHLALKRWQFWNRFSKYSLVFLYAFLISAGLYLHFFYEASAVDLQVNLPDNQSVLGTVAPTVTEQPIFDAAKLAVYNGKNGQPAYTAIDGIVYDLSLIFINGNHAGHLAGRDLTAAFHSAHAVSILKKFRQVGIYKN